jgi:hypothetical protein
VCAAIIVFAVGRYELCGENTTGFGREFAARLRSGDVEREISTFTQCGTNAVRCRLFRNVERSIFPRFRRYLAYGWMRMRREGGTRMD